MIPVSLFAQTDDLRLNIGVPLGKYGKFDHNFAGSDESNSPSLIIQLEKNWKPDFSIGAYIGYAGQKHEYNLGNTEVQYNYYRFGTSLTYELNSWLSELNIYPAKGIEMYTSAKVGLSWENEKASTVKFDSNGNPKTHKNTDNELLLDLGVLLGSRYYFNDQFGLFAELGWGNAGFFTIGTTFKL
jgi:hypothetical protein